MNLFTLPSLVEFTFYEIINVGLIKVGHRGVKIRKYDLTCGF